jgi:hypothetical protein
MRPAMKTQADVDESKAPHEVRLYVGATTVLGSRIFCFFSHYPERISNMLEDKPDKEV